MRPPTATTFELHCLVPDQWLIDGELATCPDCAALVAVSAVDHHVAWHERLLSQVVTACSQSDQLTERVVEMTTDDPGAYVQLLHDLQVVALGRRARLHGGS